MVLCLTGAACSAGGTGAELPRAAVPPSAAAAGSPSTAGTWQELPVTQAVGQGAPGGAVLIRGRVVVRTFCPPPGAGADPCVDLAYLAEPSVRSVLPYEDVPLLQLFWKGAPVRCDSAMPGDACGPFTSGHVVALAGEIRGADARRRSLHVHRLVEDMGPAGN